MVKRPDPIEAAPRRDFFFKEPHANIDGTRNLRDITAFVCHRTVSDDHVAEAIARMFRDNADMGSTTLVFDSDQTQQVMGWGAICQGASSGGRGVNVWGLHAEFCSQAWWKRVVWIRKHLRMVKRGAYQAAKASIRFDIPLVWLTAADLRAGKRHGFTDHRTISEAWVPGGHTDSVPVSAKYFLRLVRESKRRILDLERRNGSKGRGEKEHAA